MTTQASPLKWVTENLYEEQKVGFPSDFVYLLKDTQGKQLAKIVYNHDPKRSNDPDSEWRVFLPPNWAAWTTYRKTLSEVKSLVEIQVLVALAKALP